MRLSVAFLTSLGLRVENRPVPEIAGHVVIPELNTPDYGANKGSFTKLKNDLAQFASLDENIVRYPPVLHRSRP